MAAPNDTALDNAPLDGPDWGEDLFDNTLEFADNPEPRCPCVLVLDTSQSMSGEPIAALNHGLHVFRDELLAVPLARKRVEVAVVTFGATVEVVQDFVTVDRFEPPILQAGGETPLCTGILRRSTSWKRARSATGSTACRTPGRGFFFSPTACRRAKRWRRHDKRCSASCAAEAARKAAFFAVGVEGANMKLLARISVRPPLKLDGLRFADLFAWLSASTARAAITGDG